MSPLVTILTPCYNHEEYLDDYFQSLLSQTYTKIELIIIDDASTDNSWQRISDYEALLKSKFDRVLLKRHHENIGLIATLDELKGCVSGDFVSILESDDYYKPNKVSENVAYFLANRCVGAVHSDVDFIFADHIQFSHWASLNRTIPEGDIYNRLLCDNIILTCSFTCRSDLFLKHTDFRRYSERGYFTADYPMYLDLARHTKFGYLQKSLAVYRIVNNSISHPADPHKQFNWKRAYYRTKLDYIEAYGAPHSVIQRALRQYYRNYYVYGYQNFSREHFEKGYHWLVKHYRREFRSSSSRLRALALKNKTLWNLVYRLDCLEVFRHLKQWGKAKL